MIIETECVVHDAEEAKRYQNMGISESPSKIRVGFTFHMGDVKHLTQHPLPENDETALEELTIIRFHDGEGTPVTTPYAELNKKFKEYNDSREARLEQLTKKDN